MNKISLTLDVTKFNKAKISERKYVNKRNEEVTTKEYKVDVIPSKEVKVIAQGNDWVMKKTHFVVEAQTKEERAAKAPTVYVGEGFTFEKKEQEVTQNDTIDYPEEDINPDDIPF